VGKKRGEARNGTARPRTGFNVPVPKPSHPPKAVALGTKVSQLAGAVVEVYCDVTHRRCTPSAGRFDHLAEVNSRIIGVARAAVKGGRSSPQHAAAAQHLVDAERVAAVLHFLRRSATRIFAVIDRTTSRAEGARVYERSKGFTHIMELIEKMSPDSTARMQAIEDAITARERRQVNSASRRDYMFKLREQLRTSRSNLKKLPPRRVVTAAAAAAAAATAVAVDQGADDDGSPQPGSSDEDK